MNGKASFGAKAWPNSHFPKPQRRKPRPIAWSGFSSNSLTMTYFHTGTRTIIGAESFHCPVRDGKEWDQLAMVIRHNLSSSRHGLNNQFIEQISFNFDCVT